MRQNHDELTFFGEKLPFLNISILPPPPPFFRGGDDPLKSIPGWYGP